MCFTFARFSLPSARLSQEDGQLLDAGEIPSAIRLHLGFMRIISYLPFRTNAISCHIKQLSVLDRLLSTLSSKAPSSHLEMVRLHPPTWAVLGGTGRLILPTWAPGKLVSVSIIT